MRLHFTVRDLLWLTLVVALATGWWLDHMRLTPIVLNLQDGQREPHSASEVIKEFLGVSGPAGAASDCVWRPVRHGVTDPRLDRLRTASRGVDGRTDYKPTQAERVTAAAWVSN